MLFCDELASSIIVEISHVHFIACFHGDVQLTTMNEVKGVVQICYKGDWRFVCKNSDWGTQEASRA